MIHVFIKYCISPKDDRYRLKINLPLMQMFQFLQCQYQACMYYILQVLVILEVLYGMHWLGLN